MKDFYLDDILVQGSRTVRDAMKKLDMLASKILFVVDPLKALIGSLTDGDIRRWILKNGSLEAEVSGVCNHGTLRAVDGFDEAEVLVQMERLGIVYAPVVDSEGKILDILVRKTVSGATIRKKNAKLDIPVVIMAGGKGTRLAPFTNVLPKPLIPVGDKTILELIIDEFKRFGISEYFFTINYRGEMIRAYFDNIERDYKITYIKESEFRGTAGSLALLPAGFPKTFIVSNCDILIKADFADMLEFHRKSEAVLTVVSSIQHHKIPYGVLKFEDGGVVVGLEEKPEVSFCINTGVYILEADCLSYIPKDEVFHMTHLIAALMRDGKRVVTYPVNESEYVDIGQWDEYRQAVKQLT